MQVVSFTEKRPPDIEAVKWTGNPAEAHEFAKLWPDADGFHFYFKGKSLTIDRPDGLSLILLRGAFVEVQRIPVASPNPAHWGETQLVAKRVLSTIDLDGYERKAG